MQRFDCLSRNCPLFGPHLLEASAGTGKTFSIEHVYVRLILESRKKDPIEVENILVVTFTRAATRELKSRIRANFEKAISFLQSNDRAEEREGAWDYLKPYLETEESSDAVRALSDALSAFEKCQIFTIHGFCWRMLNEFAFEANEGFSLPDPDVEKRISGRIRKSARDFLAYGLNEGLLCPEQAALLLKKYDSIDELAERLLLPKKGQGFSFSDFHEAWKAALHTYHGGQGGGVEKAKLIDDFLSLESGFKKMEGDFKRQAEAFANCITAPESTAPFRELLREKNSLFDFLDPENRKIKAVPPERLHYPGIFDWGRTRLLPLIQAGRKKIFPTLQAAWHPIAEKIRSEESAAGPDEILQKMKIAVENERFANGIRKKYAAAIIDEFQDTDAVQWDIFRKLFLEGPPLRALYLVGDPKQSIYRFRKADLYIYLEAKELLSEQNLYHLDTNFRSSKKMVDALNALFARDWLTLPKLEKTLPFLPCRSGSKADSIFSDQKGAVHFLLAEESETDDLFEEIFLPFATQEIEKLLPEVKKESSFAILVKDRFQAEKALQFFRQNGIAAVARSRTPLGQTLAFQAMSELFDAILTPSDESAAKIVESGPFGESLPFSDFKILLEEKGIVSFCREFLKEKAERIVSYDLSFYRDLMQIFEFLFDWEAKEGFSIEGLLRFFNDLKTLKEDEGGRRRMEADEAAVQIMTLHVSKGLEFDIVFALGLSSRTPKSDEESEEEAEELNAEKLRQLYVAMTRAKRRLYVPAAFSEKESEPSSRSPIELFSEILEAPLVDFLEKISQKESVTFEKLSLSSLTPSVRKERPLNALLEAEFIEARSPFTPSYLNSFSSLAPSHKNFEGFDSQTKPESFTAIGKPQKSEEFTLHTLPKGTETGIAVHGLFEKIFSSAPPAWRDREALQKIVEEELRFSFLRPWQEAIQQMVLHTISSPLTGEGVSFSLEELDPTQLQVEMEFLFDTPPHFVKGFIDLVFSHQGKFYFIDWKTNWLGEGDSAYQILSLKKTMESHAYPLQATLYAEAIRRYLGLDKDRFQDVFGGAFYLFLRGGAHIHLKESLKELWKI